MSRACITCGQPTRRRWYDQAVCYGCAGVRVGGGLTSTGNRIKWAELS